MNKPLTPEQDRVFSFISAWLEKHGVPPTIREIAASLGYKSINNVRQHLRLIAQKGFLRLMRGKARGIEVLVGREREFDEGRSLSLPLIGAVAAGKPITAQENIDDYVTIDHTLFKGQGLFTLRIKGDSMSGIGVLNGDIVIVRQESQPKDGDIVVAVIDGDATLKRYIRENDRIILRPENPAYEDIVVTPEQDITIAGKMVGLIRKC